MTDKDDRAGGGVKPIKSLGQNFLKDPVILNRIATESKLKKEDIIVEIGAGTGALTSVAAKNAGFVYAIEIDKYLIPMLESKFKGTPNVAIVHRDVLKMDFTGGPVRAMIAEGAPEPPAGCSGKVRIISNLPYYITTPIIMKLLEELPEPADMTFMMQKEVADRIAAPPGTKQYGALSVAVRYYAEPEYLFTVKPDSFYPKPEVDSAVVRLAGRENPAVTVDDRDYFFRVIKAAFGQRRKTLVNALANSGVAGSDKGAIADVLAKTGIGANDRGETLSIDKFAILTNELCRLGKA